MAMDMASKQIEVTHVQPNRHRANNFEFDMNVVAVCFVDSSETALTSNANKWQTRMFSQTDTVPIASSLI